MIKPIFITEGMRMLRRAIKVKRLGIKRYKGNAVEICERILEDCYNRKKQYYQVSAGHFCEFWSRDFSWIVKSLIELGYNDRVKNTLDYALRHFQKHGRITTTISPNGICFDFPIYAVDSLPSILYSLSVLDDKNLVEKYRGFLENEIEYFMDTVVDSGMVRKDRTFSSMKDHSKRVSSCYDNCMLYLMQSSSARLSLTNPLARFDYEKLIMDRFWTGEYFLDDLSGRRYVAGDANVFPFWVGCIKDKEILKKAIASIRKHRLDKPFPLKYTARDTEVKMRFFELFAKDYERHVVWTHMGPIYIKIVGEVDKKLQSYYLSQYKEMIEKHRNYLEIFNPTGKPFCSFFYYSDEGMSWCANYLIMTREINA